jgi:hypothetical protein
MQRALHAPATGERPDTEVIDHPVVEHTGVVDAHLERDDLTTLMPPVDEVAVRRGPPPKTLQHFLGFGKKLCPLLRHKVQPHEVPPSRLTTMVTKTST